MILKFDLPQQVENLLNLPADEKLYYSVPCDIDELMLCPGVGKKIANLIVGEVYGKPALVVDTHCKRVMKRMGITTHDDPLKVEKDCCEVFPEQS